MYIHRNTVAEPMLKRRVKQQTGLPGLVPLPCACANLRRAARAVTQLYAEEFRPIGLEPTQFTSLTALETWRELTQGQLAERLAIDSTTLTRTLAPLRRRGWIQARPGPDRRERHLRLTPAGRRQLARVRPYWERAQQRLRRTLGEDGWKRLQAGLVEVTRAVQRA